jgi:hypothetical protein
MPTSSHTHVHDTKTHDLLNQIITLLKADKSMGNLNEVWQPRSDATGADSANPPMGNKSRSSSTETGFNADKDLLRDVRGFKEMLTSQDEFYSADFEPLLGLLKRVEKVLVDTHGNGI